MIIFLILILISNLHIFIIKIEIKNIIFRLLSIHRQKPDKKMAAFKKVSEFVNRATTAVYNSVFVNIIVYFIMCNLVHHYTSRVYIYFCAYSTIMFQLNSFLMSPIVIISPHCMALRWLIMESSNTVYFQILACCSWIIARITK